MSFEIGAGETYGLLGPNGAGKTTTISIVAGVLRADAGSVTVAGELVTANASAAKHGIGLVPQEVALYDDLTGRENLVFFGRLQGLAGAELGTAIDDVLGVVGLDDRADDRVDTYSGGMKRRANIAAGLLHRPQLLILDEPTVGVDPQSRNQILESIERLGGQGLSVLYTTHYMEEAERLCDRVGIIDDGRIVAEGARSDLVRGIGQQSRVRIDVTGDVSALAERVRTLPGVSESTAVDGSVTVLADSAGEVIAPVVSAAQALGLAIVAIDVRQPDLEAVFLHHTGKALRD